MPPTSLWRGLSPDWIFLTSARPTRATMRAGLADRALAATNRERVEQTKLRATEDFKEGVKATAERHVANFRGR